MKLSQFKFKLPEEKIALHPAKYRDESRLMVVHKDSGQLEHVVFKDILNYFVSNIDHSEYLRFEICSVLINNCVCVCVCVCVHV